MTESKRDAFVRLANKRVNTAIKAIQLVANLGNRANYEYEPKQANKIIKALQTEVENARKKFNPDTGGDNGGFVL